MKHDVKAKVLANSTLHAWEETRLEEDRELLELLELLLCVRGRRSSGRVRSSDRGRAEEEDVEDEVDAGRT